MLTACKDHFIVIYILYESVCLGGECSSQGKSALSEHPVTSVRFVTRGKKKKNKHTGDRLIAGIYHKGSPGKYTPAVRPYLGNCCADDTPCKVRGWSKAVIKRLVLKFVKQVPGRGTVRVSGKSLIKHRGALRLAIGRWSASCVDRL